MSSQEHFTTIFNNTVYYERVKAIEKCAFLAKKLSFGIFGVQHGGQCFAADEATYDRYGLATNCHDGKGGEMTNDVYIILIAGKEIKPVYSFIIS